MEYLSEIPQMVPYTFRGEGPKVAVIGGCGLGVSAALAEAFPVAAVLFVPALGYLFTYALDVTKLSASGRIEPPDMPDPRDVLGTFVKPFGIFFVLWMLAYAPMCAAVGLATLLGLESLAWFLGGLLFVAGSITFPIVFLTYAFRESLRDAANYMGLHRSAMKILPFYAFTLVLYVLLTAVVALVIVFGAFGTRMFLGSFPVLANIITYGAGGVVWGFVIVAECFLLGRLYYHFKDQLAW